jgi:predicted nucleotide-binding protein
MMTPDDVARKVGGTADALRARQNVVFELGYFYGKLGRRSGRVILLHKGGLEIPSDIAGVVYIDISNGIEASGESIRRELRELL